MASVNWSPVESIIYTKGVLTAFTGKPPTYLYLSLDALKVIEAELSWIHGETVTKLDKIVEMKVMKLPECQGIIILAYEEFEMEVKND